MNKAIMKDLGLEKEMERVDAGFCPFCQAKIGKPSDFRDEISLIEFSISGLCQACQDSMFGDK